MRHIIRNVSIFDGSGSATAAGAVVIEGDRIAAVLDADDALPTQLGDVAIDGRGGTLMPGLIEAHAHLTWPSSVEKMYHQFVLPPEEMNIAARRNARVLLDHGFTSAFSAGALGDTIEVTLRDDIAAGRTPGPRLRASTLERSPEAADGIETGKKLSIGEGPAAMRAFVRRCADNRVDTVKLVISGEDALLPQTPGAGERFIQPWIESPGARRLLDDVTGQGWRLFVLDNAAAAVAASAAHPGLRIAVIEVAGLADNGALQDWLAARQVGAVLVRPDFYVFGSTAADPAWLVDMLAQALGKPASDDRKAQAA